MSRNFVIAFVVGIACIAIAVAGIFYMQRGAHVEPVGKVLKIRTASLDERSSLAVVDFRIANTSDYPFMVRTVTVIAEFADGSTNEGQTVSEPDAKRVFAGLPVLGTKYNDTLVMRDRLPAHTSWDRMVAARFELPEDKLQARKRLVVKIEEVDGQVIEVAQTPTSAVSALLPIRGIALARLPRYFF